MTPKNRKFKNKINVFTKEPEKDMPANSGDSSGVHTKWIEDAAENYLKC